MRELQEHFLAPACISMYNKDLEASLKSEDSRPEHDMRDHDALRDACQFLLIAADLVESQLETIVRLLFNEVSRPRVLHHFSTFLPTFPVPQYAERRDAADLMK